MKEREREILIDGKSERMRERERILTHTAAVASLPIPRHLSKALEGRLSVLDEKELQILQVTHSFEFKEKDI